MWFPGIPESASRFQRDTLALDSFVASKVAGLTRQYPSNALVASLAFGIAEAEAQLLLLSARRDHALRIDEHRRATALDGLLVTTGSLHRSILRDYDAVTSDIDDEVGSQDKSRHLAIIP